MLEKIKNLIKADNRTLYRLSKDSGLEYSLLHNLINNNKKGIRLDTAFKLADALGVDVNAFRDK